MSEESRGFHLVVSSSLDHGAQQRLEAIYKDPFFVVQPMLSRILLSAQVGFIPQLSIHTDFDLCSAVRKAASAEIDLHIAIVLLINFSMAYDTLQCPLYFRR